MPLEICPRLFGKYFAYYSPQRKHKTTCGVHHKGKTATYIGIDKKMVTTNKGFEHLAVFEKNGKNRDGGTTGALTLYKQNKVVLQTTEPFSGNDNYSGTKPIDDGNYYMRLDIRNVSNPVNLIDTSEGLQPEITWGLENFPKGGQMTYKGKKYGTNEDVTNAYGFSRIRLIPAKDLGNKSKDRGLYLHGKQDSHNWTHGCLCDKNEQVQRYFTSGGGAKFSGKVPLSVKKH